MARRQTSPDTFGLPAICNVCWRSCITMDQEGVTCWHCERGVFVHRMFWVQTLCGACGGTGACGRCEKGLIVQPTEDLAILAQFPTYMEQLDRTRMRCG